MENPVCGTNYPVRENRCIVGGSHFPVGGSHFPVGGSHFPVGGSRFPVGGNHFPRHFFGGFQRVFAKTPINRVFPSKTRLWGHSSGKRAATTRKMTVRPQPAPGKS